MNAGNSFDRSLSSSLGTFPPCLNPISTSPCPSLLPPKIMPLAFNFPQSALHFNSPRHPPTLQSLHSPVRHFNLLLHPLILQSISLIPRHNLFCRAFCSSALPSLPKDAIVLLLLFQPPFHVHRQKEPHQPHGGRAGHALVQGRETRCSVAWLWVLPAATPPWGFRRHAWPRSLPPEIHPHRARCGLEDPFYEWLYVAQSRSLWWGQYFVVAVRCCRAGARCLSCRATPRRRLDG